MSLFTVSELRRRAQAARQYAFSNESLLEEKVIKQASVSSHDIFLSHAFSDKELILAVALTLEDLGFSVYLDWRDDPDLNRSSVTPDTAIQLRKRMKASKCLFYATTDRSSSSKWMPWELGYKDGDNSQSAILPIREGESRSFAGQEYLGIYPYINQAREKSGRQCLWVHKSPECYVVFDAWLRGAEPTER